MIFTIIGLNISSHFLFDIILFHIFFYFKMWKDLLWLKFDMELFFEYLIIYDEFPNYRMFWIGCVDVGWLQLTHLKFCQRGQMCESGGGGQNAYFQNPGGGAFAPFRSIRRRPCNPY